MVCLDARAIGRSHRLHATRPGPEHNRPVYRADVIGAQGSVLDVTPTDAQEPMLTRVDISGVLEQRAGYHEPCAGYTDGHDAIAERLCAAFTEGDVLLVTDSPGGAHAGLQEAVRTALDAKAEHGRRVTAWVGEMCGSAAAWWALALADEVFLPESGIIGSIGARAAHCSIAGALEKEGVSVTYFAAPSASKVAFAEELPLSEEGKARGERDVWIAYEAFERAVCEGPVGMRHGLNPEKLRALDADALTGQRAVDQGLADGVASLKDVMLYALALASSQEASMGSSYEKKTTERYEEDDEPEKSEPEERKANGAEDDRRAEDEEESGDEDDRRAEDEEEDPPPSSKPMPPPPKDGQGHPPPPERMRRHDDLAAMSVPAMKAEIIDLRRIRDYASTLTGQQRTSSILGGLEALAKDAAASARYKDELRAANRRANRQERMALLRKLVIAGVHSPGEVFTHDDRGRVIGPSKLWGPGRGGRSLLNLQGYVQAKLQNGGGAPRRNPYQPDAALAETSSTEARIKRDAQSPEIRRMAENSSASPERLAAARNALLAQGGA